MSKQLYLTCLSRLKIWIKKKNAVYCVFICATSQLLYTSFNRHISSFRFTMQGCNQTSFGKEQQMDLGREGYTTKKEKEHESIMGV